MASCDRTLLLHTQALGPVELCTAVSRALVPMEKPASP